MCEHQNEAECEVCGCTADRLTSRCTCIGWVCEGCFPTYVIISDKMHRALQATLQENVKSTIAAAFK